MEHDIVDNNKLPAVPGIGAGGIVMCPYFRGPCLKGGCELWVELKYGSNTVGRCAHAWQPVVMVELREEMVRLSKGGKDAASAKGSADPG